MVLLNLYVQALALAIFVLSIFCSGILLGLPNVFRVNQWVKAAALFGFLAELTGGMILFQGVKLGSKLHILWGTGALLTAMTITSGMFLYVHAVILRARVRDRELNKRRA